MPAVAAIAMLASCSDDDIANDGRSDVAKQTETRYIRLVISDSSSSSRADEASTTSNFTDGETTESDINEISLVFYDSDGNIVGSRYDMDASTTPNFDSHIATESNDPSITKIFSSIVPVTIPQGSNLPAYVMCYVNPIERDNYLEKKTLAAIQQDTRTAATKKKTIDGTEVTLFPMNNSVYYGYDEVSNTYNAKIVATPIRSTLLYKTEDEAKAANAETVNIYVERYAAKVKVSYVDNAFANQTNLVKGYQLKFVPEKWGLSADESTMYLIKAYFDSNADGTVNFNSGLTHSHLASVFSGWTWNDELNHRSYWSCTPAYYSSIYPQVADQVVEDEAKTDTEKVYKTDYHSYNEYTAADGKCGYAMNTSQYVLECTVGKNGLTSANPKAAVPSAVILGHYELYKVENGTASTTAESQQDFYLLGKNDDGTYNIYFDDNTDNSIRNVLLRHQSVVTVAANETKSITDAQYSSYFTIEHPKAGVRGSVILDSRYVCLQVVKPTTPSTSTGIYFYNADGSTTEITDTTSDETINTINRRLMEDATVLKYSQGRGYFAVPIRHLGWQRNDNANKDATVIDWTKVNVGDFGIVRNHIYELEITGCTGLATAISDPDVPIVPPMDEQTYYVAMKLNILAWRIVPKQTVVL